MGVDPYNSQIVVIAGPFGNNQNRYQTRSFGAVVSKPPALTSALLEAGYTAEDGYEASFFVNGQDTFATIQDT
jgi:hypothetical protein